MKKINFKKIFVYCYLLINILFNCSYADDLYIRKGIHEILHGNGIVDYVSRLDKETNKNYKNIMLDHWHVISDALDNILAQPNIQGFHVIHEPVTGALHTDGVPRTPATQIGIDVENYAKGDR